MREGSNGIGGERTTGGGREFNPDPALFPATWLPLRWLQIFALAKVRVLRFVAVCLMNSLYAMQMLSVELRRQSIAIDYLLQWLS